MFGVQASSYLRDTEKMVKQMLLLDPKHTPNSKPGSLASEVVPSVPRYFHL